MDARYYHSQPVNNNAQGIPKNPAYFSQPNTQHFNFERMNSQIPDGSLESTIRTEQSVLNAGSVSTDNHCAQTLDSDSCNINRLFKNYKSVSEELATTLMEFRTEKITLENELGRLNQENEYLVLELDRQKAHMADLKETSNNLSEKLTKEEAETKKIMELKLLEINEVFGSISSVDEFINNFKRDFSESVSKAQEFCKNIKNNLKQEQGSSLKSSSDYLNSFNEYIVEYTSEINSIKQRITETKTNIESGLITYKEKSVEEANYKYELNNLLLEIEVEQKRKKELEQSLLHYSNLIVRNKEEHQFQTNNMEPEKTEMKRHISELQLKNISLDNELGATEEDGVKLKARHNQLSSELNSLQAVLIQKRHDDEIIDQEMQELEKQAELLRTGCSDAQSEKKRKLCVETELRGLEIQLKSMMEKCKELEATRDKARNANPSDELVAKKARLEQFKLEQQDLANKVDSAKSTLAEKQEAEKAYTEQRQTLSDELKEKLSLLENPTDGEEDLEILRRENEEYSIKVNRSEEEIEKKKKVILSLQEYFQEQTHIYQELTDDLDDTLIKIDEGNYELFEKYKSALESMEKLHVDNLDDRIKRVTSDIEFNEKKTEEATEVHKNEIDKMQGAHKKTIKGLDKEVEEHMKYCDDMLAKLDSEMRCIQDKIPNIEHDIEGNKKDLSAHVPKLATSVRTALSLFEKIIQRYTDVCEKRQSTESTSIHWDNAKEVLQEILLLPIHKLSKLRGMPYVDTMTATPHVYRIVICKAQQMFDSIISNREKRPVEYVCKKMMEMRHAMYQSKDTDSPTSSKLNDTVYSTSTED